MRFEDLTPGAMGIGRLLLAHEARELLDLRDGEPWESSDLRDCLEQMDDADGAVMAYLGKSVGDVTGAIVKRADQGQPVAEIWVTLDSEPSDPNGNFCLIYNTAEPITGKELAERGLALLVEARELFKRADNKQTVERIRLAISSAKGAIRIQTSRAVRKECQ